MKKVILFIVLFALWFWVATASFYKFIEDGDIWFMPFGIIGFIFGFGDENYAWIGNAITALILAFISFFIIREFIFKKYFK